MTTTTTAEPRSGRCERCGRPATYTSNVFDGTQTRRWLCSTCRIQRTGPTTPTPESEDN